MKNCRLGMAWNTWREKAEQMMEEKRVARKFIKMMRGTGLRDYMESWREYAGHKHTPSDRRSSVRHLAF